MDDAKKLKGFAFGKRGLANLAQCHPDLQRIAHELIKEMDVTIICGHRGEAEQNEAFARGNSKLRWPDSKHNKTPSLAFDACPSPINWDDAAGFKEMRERMGNIAKRLGIKVRFIS